MGLTQSIYAENEVAAPPETVRSVLLDFHRHKQWHQIYTIKSLDPSIEPAHLKPGHKLDVDIKGYPFKFQFQPTIAENSPDSFQWLGGPRWIFQGKHQFHFAHSKTTPGGTTLVQMEEFHGLFAFLIGPSWDFGRTSQKMFEALSNDLKAESERVAAS